MSSTMGTARRGSVRSDPARSGDVSSLTLSLSYVDYFREPIYLRGVP
jgi:hypothetical protein